MQHPSDDATAHDQTRPERLSVAAAQLRLASTALAALAHLVDEQDEVLEPHIERLEHRAVELMRTASRLARDMGVAERWGLDLLFAPPVNRAPVRPLRSSDTIDLEPLELLAPLEAETPPRRLSRTSPPWAPQVVLPTPPLDSLATADESLC